MVLNKEKEQPQNIISHVALGHEAESVWIDALSDVGRIIRQHTNQPTGFLKMGEEVAVQLPAGGLRLSTTIAGELVQMDVPPGMWWHTSNDSSVDRNAN